MSAPAKPWEQDRYGGRVLNSSAPMSMLSNPAGRIRTGSPQLPPRPSSLSNSYGSSGYSSMGMYGPRAYSGYNSYSYGGLGGMGSYGGYGGYGSYGGYGYGGGMYNGYGGGMYGAESRFIQLAEESTRPAFQGIESLVRAFGSIAMMLDSTFFAVTSSFRAVLGVAENFGRIRSMFGQLWSSFALLRAINWMYRKFMSLLGVKIPADVGKQAWDQAIKEAGTEATQNVSSWPIFMFLGMIISAPYIISKLLPPILDKRNPENWTEPGMRAGVQYNFQASNSEELSMNKGDEIIIAPKSIQDEMNLTGTGWVFAASKTGTGLVPLNYLYPANKPPQTQTSTPMPDEQISDPRFLPAETIPNETRIFPKSTTTDAKKRVTFNDTILTNEETPLNPQEPPKVEVTNETAQNVPASSQNELNNTKNN